MSSSSLQSKQEESPPLKQSGKKTRRKPRKEEEGENEKSKSNHPENGTMALCVGRYSRLRKYFRDIALEEMYHFTEAALILAAFPPDKLLMKLFVDEHLGNKLSK